MDLHMVARYLSLSKEGTGYGCKLRELRTQQDYLYVLLAKERVIA